MRYWGQEILRLWLVVGILATGQRRLQDRVADAYQLLVVNLYGRVPDEMSKRFETLCEEYIQEGKALARYYPDAPDAYFWAARNFMNYRRASYFAESIFEFCRDTIEIAHQEMED